MVMLSAFYVCLHDCSKKIALAIFPHHSRLFAASVSGERQEGRYRKVKSGLFI